MPASGPPDPSSLPRPWVEGYPPGVPPDYQVPRVALPRFLDDAVRDFPHRTALVCGRDALDHVSFRDRVADLADVLRMAGVSRGDRVLVGLPNLATLPVVLFAVWRVAAVAVPVGHDLGADRLGEVAADAHPSAVIGTRRFVRDLPEPGQRPLTTIVVDDDGWLFPGHRHRIRRRLARLRRARPQPAGGYLEGTVRLQEALDAREGSVPGSATAPDPEDLALLTYDTRSVGRPAFGFAHANLVASAFQARLWIPDAQAGRERILVVEPLTAPTALVTGLLMGSLTAGTVICVDEPDPGDLARAVERERPTLLTLSVERLGSLLSAGDAAKRDLTSLRVVLTTGASLDPRLGAEMERRTGGGRIRGCFGVDGAALTHAQPVYGRSVAGAMGLPVTSTVAAVVEPDRLDVLCAPGAPGRLLVHGPQVTRELGEGAADRFVGDWLVSDELATCDTDGVFHHLGNLDELVRRAGTWVSPRETEAVLVRHPAVRRAGVVAGSTDGSLRAAVVCGRRGRPSEEDLLVHCRAHLDSPAVPDEVILLDELPETDAGDLARDELRQLLAGR